jgi:hypothetical protein
MNRCRAVKLGHYPPGDVNTPEATQIRSGLFLAAPQPGFHKRAALYLKESLATRSTEHHSQHDEPYAGKETQIAVMHGRGARPVAA